jgi:hypothetical protein
MSKISDEEHARLDQDLHPFFAVIVKELDLDIAAHMLLFILQGACAIYSTKGRPLNGTYFEFEACRKLLHQNQDVLDLLKRAHKDKKYADVRNFRGYHLFSS